MILSELQSLYKARVVPGTEIQLKEVIKKSQQEKQINILMQNETHSFQLYVNIREPAATYMPALLGLLAPRHPGHAPWSASSLTNADNSVQLP